MEHLQAVLGAELLTYLLACEEHEVERAGTEWTDRQRDAIQHLEGVVSSISRQEGTQKRLLISQYLLQYSEIEGRSLAKSIRAHCGGDIVAISETGDHFQDCLRQIASDLYPAFLFPTTEDSSLLIPTLSSALHRHPRRLELFKLIATDSKLKYFYPGAPKDPEALRDQHTLYEIQSNIIVSFGRSGSFQLVGLPGMILTSAYHRAILNGSVSLAHFVAIVAEVVEDVRKLATGHQVLVPTIIEIGGITLPEGKSITFPWGEIRSATSSDARILRLRGRNNIVLVTKAPLKVLSKRTWDPEEIKGERDLFSRHKPRFEESDKQLTRIINLTRYALILASRGRRLHRCVHKSTTILDPLAHGPVERWQFESPIQTDDLPILDSDIPGIEKWGSRLNEYPRELDVAMRRTLSAAIDRLDPLDGFIDAVLAWENIFSSSPETSLRVCGALARIIERSDFARRRELYEELLELYRSRSNIVHGGIKEPSLDDAIKLRNRAVEVALDAMRALYSPGMTELLRRDSSARSKYILLGYLDPKQEHVDTSSAAPRDEDLPA